MQPAGMSGAEYLTYKTTGWRVQQSASFKTPNCIELRTTQALSVHDIVAR